IGYLFTDLFLLLITLKRSRILSVHLTEIRIPGEHIRQIFGIGLSAAVVNIMQSICIILLNQSLLPYGTAYIAAMGIVQKVNMIAMLILVGLAFGGQPMFGYYYGSGDSRRLRRLLRFCMRFISLAAVLLTAFVFGFAPALIRIFMQDPSIVSIGTIMLRWQVITMVCVGFILLITILFQSFGKIAGSMFLALSRQGIVFIAVLLIASRTVGYQGILAAQAVSDLITIGIAGILYRVQILRLPVVQGDK
ncbi:MAG: MATE family efflux transporter, partial [Eubacterium sp.]